jgi:hypothetical protein
MRDETHLVQLCTVMTEPEGQILCDLLNSGGIPAMLHSFQISGYGMFTASFGGGWGEVLVHAKNLAEARHTVELWQVPLLEESDAAPIDQPCP